MSFCDISFNRKSGVVTDVLNKEGRESALYPQLVSYVQQDPQTVYDSKKEYFDTLVDQGKLVDKSTGELSLGLYSIAYNSSVSEQEFMDRINRDGNLSVFGVGGQVGGQQVTKKTKESLEKELIDGFLSDFNITVSEYEDLKKEIGFDAYTASDLVAKAIAYKKGESILPEVAYFAYSMLGKQNNKIRSELRYLINKWDKYRERFEYHKKIISEKEGFVENRQEWKTKIKDLVILDFLKENLEDYYFNPRSFEKTNDSKWTAEDFSLWQKIIKTIEKFLESLNIMSNEKKKKKLESLGLSIADEVLNRNYQYFNYELKEDQIRKYYKDTIESDSFAKELVEFGQKELGLVLTGSLALRKAGTVYRTADETLHDIDWVVPYELTASEENKKVLEKIKRFQGPDVGFAGIVASEEIEKLSWFKEFKKKYPSYTLLNGFYGGEHNSFESFTVQGVIDGKFYAEDGYHEEEVSFYKKDPETQKPVKVKEKQKVKHKKGDWIKNSGYVIDFFVRLKPMQEEHENYFKLWKEIMVAKIKMGRDKDFIDWKAFVPYLKSKDSYNFNYEGFRHFNYESTGNAFEDSRNVEQKSMVEPVVVKKEKAAPNSTEMFLKDTVEKGLSKENQLLAKRLSSIPGFKNVTVEVANIPQYVMYNKAENKVQVSQVAMETVDPIAFEKAILNTVMESIADNMLTTNRNALRSNQKFYGYISDMVKDLERRMPQEMKDMMNQPTLEGKVAAFISQYMSNPELREWSNKRIGDKKNFWNQLSNFVAVNLFDKKILETSMYEFLSELENIPTVVAPAIVNNVLANNTPKVEQLPDYSSLANIYGDLSFFDSAKVRIKEQINMEDLKNKVAAVNRFYGGEVLSLVETKDGTELRFSSSNLNKLIENGKKFMEKKREEKNKMELSKEIKKEARMVDTIPELSFLTEEQKEEAERLLKSNEFNLQCGL